MPKSIDTRTIGALALGAAVAVAATWFAAGESSARNQAFPASLASWTISGNLTVELRIDPSAGAAATEWQGAIQRVSEVTLFEDYAVLRRRDTGRTGILVVPRDKLLWINVVH